MPIRLKLVPDGEPDADGEWVEIDHPGPIPGGWQVAVHEFKKFVPEGKHIVQMEQYRDPHSDSTKV